VSRQPWVSSVSLKDNEALTGNGDPRRQGGRQSHDIAKARKTEITITNAIKDWGSRWDISLLNQAVSLSYSLAGSLELANTVTLTAMAFRWNKRSGQIHSRQRPCHNALQGSKNPAEHRKLLTELTQTGAGAGQSR